MDTVNRDFGNRKSVGALIASARCWVSFPEMKRRISHDQWSQQSRVLDKRCAHIRRRTIITLAYAPAYYSHSRHTVFSLCKFADFLPTFPVPRHTPFLQASSSKSSSTTS